MKREALKTLLEKHGQRYSEALGIKLQTVSDNEVFKWFLAAVLFGAPITESSVIKTYKCFEKHSVLTPKKILETGWDGLVKILDEGSYTRYDFKTADKLLLVMGNLQQQYNGSLNLLYQQAHNHTDLENRLKQLGKGIGDITVSIFLRDLRGIWKKADPKPTPLVISAAKSLGLTKSDDPQKVLDELKSFWNKNKIAGYTFVSFETALLRLGKEQRRQKQSQ
jgi:hypothetical protein